MGVIDGRTWMEHLSATRCWELLASTPVGRIGVLYDSAPEIYPVNYLAVDHTIVFRSDIGSKLSALDRSPAVCFQVDEIDADSSTGWSVLVKGRAALVKDPAERRYLDAQGLRHWSLGHKAHWVRIVPVEVTGRRIWSRPGN
ncbi:MAG TPA: pyridoxamine 5'-phosphate oxidase family protein [Acidimicrobiales bacterium]|jgi:nitroimidazol reductase NimA-like FMN-containing flavoprotein (pyridoxamine 5'-phosphate oxidase superfamily)